MTNPRSLLATLAADPSRLHDVPRDQLPEVAAHLEALRARVWARLSRPPEPDPPPDPEPKPDRLLNVEAVADVLDVDARYVYDHADDWPFTRRISQRKLRFSERGLYRWLDSR